MNSKVFFSAILLTIWVMGNVYAQEKKEEATIRRTEVYSLKSSENGFKYPIMVALPASYQFSSDDYPVVYMLDAYSSFGIMVQLQRLMLFNKEVPEVIIVGISSEGGSKEFNYNRSRDYTPTHIPIDSIPIPMRSMLPASGGAKEFLSFIKNDLIKFIENKFRCKSDDKTFVGHSLGGLFGYYTLFNEPDLFQRLVLISPALSWDKEYMLKQEDKFSESHKILSKRIYTTIGSLESISMLQPWQRMVDSIKKHNYSGLTFDAVISNNETHYSIIPYLATHGLKSVFAK